MVLSCMTHECQILKLTDKFAFFSIFLKIPFWLTFDSPRLAGFRTVYITKNQTSKLGYIKIKEFILQNQVEIVSSLDSTNHKEGPRLA